MKRLISFMIAVAISMMLFGCTKTEPIQTTTAPATSHPVVSGTFLQAWAFAYYDQAKMTQHLQYLKDVGIDLLIVQSTFDISDGVSRVYFESDFTPDQKADSFHDQGKGMLEVVLAAAQTLDMKVYVGLGGDSGWWQKVFSDPKWLDDHVELNMAGARQIYQQYKQNYEDTLVGWYFWPEYWNKVCSADEIVAAAGFLKNYRDGLYAIDPNMPMLLSPFISASASTAAETQKMWTDILAGANLRQGDIFCCQDSVGAGHIELSQLDEYYAALKAAVDTQTGIRFWSNNEDFTPDFKSADMARFKQQLDITHKYTDTHISFAFCHYRNPEIGKTRSYEAYKHYYQTGTLMTNRASAPDVMVEVQEKGMYVTFEITADNSKGDVYALILTKDGQVMSTVYFDSDSADQQIVTSVTDVNSGTGFVDRFYTIYTMDFFGNISEENVQIIPIFT